MTIKFHMYFNATSRLLLLCRHCRARNAADDSTSGNEDLFASDDEEFAAIASQIDASGDADGEVFNWGVWTNPESPDETSFEHFASQLTDSQLNGITHMDDVGKDEGVDESCPSPMRKCMQKLEL